MHLRAFDRENKLYNHKYKQISKYFPHLSYHKYRLKYITKYSHLSNNFWIVTAEWRDDSENSAVNFYKILIGNDKDKVC